ncbi:hypothetical protein [[Clostridium] colinum]|uniref:hypothetical protein n=1 Tax=[Clostridium] colinum TaxID=36835 RepID=UPI002024BDDB|nr:hypothetical protein [[Clostridium] colinum]
MKKIKTIIAIILIFSFCFNSVSIFAKGDTNIGNGGNDGDYDNGGSGRPDTILDNEQDEGVRVTLVDAKTYKPVTSPMDFANNPRQPIQKYLGTGYKLYYKENKKVNMYDGAGYRCKKPDIKLPKIVGGDLQTIKNYFGSEKFLKNFSNLTGFDYEKMISGNYKLMLEPVGYPKIAGKVTACTATELALLDVKMNGYVSNSYIKNFSHMNLPLAMFLERDEFGIKKWTGATNTKQKNDTIIAMLGVGAVTFVPEEPEKPPIIPPSYEYRANTDVYTSLELTGIDCLLYYQNKEIKNPVTVTFNIDGKDYKADNDNGGGIVFKGTGIAYVKWHTPNTPQDMVIKAKVSYKEVEYNEITGKPYLKSKTDEYDIGVKIVEIKEKTPPNPDADDKNSNFKFQDPQIIANNNIEGSWLEYDVNLESIPIFNNKGEWIRDKEEWIWTTYEYKAYLGTFLNIYPAPLCKTYESQNYDLYHNSKAGIHTQRFLYKLKSGYGIRQKIESKLIVKKTTKVKHLDGTFEDYTEVVANVGIAPQNAINYFSDFYFKNYFRLSEVTDLSSNKSIMEFKKNPYSTYQNRTHFTPIWYPDNEFYVVNSMVFDAWIPSGQLYIGAHTTNGASVSQKTAGNAIYIKGNLWDDWYVQPLPTYGTDPREITIN